MTEVAIIDSGGANIASVQFALRRLGVASELTANADRIRAAKAVILPGVGAARAAMQRLHETKLVDVIGNLQQPLLGICLGMQLLCEGSEEEDVECLGILPGIAAKLPTATGLPVPNMGWCRTTTAAHPALQGIEPGSYFYYVHSYALPVSDLTIATAEHSAPFSRRAGT